MKNGEKPVANPFVMLREEFDDWAVLFNPDTGRGFGLSPTGVYVWKLFNGKQTLDHMIEEIRNHAEDVPRNVGDSLKAFLDELVEEGLVGVHQDDRISPVPQSGKYSSSIGIAMQVKTFKYEPPHLIDLSGAGRARGACAYNYCCTSGTNPSGGTNTCFTGGCAGRQCWGWARTRQQV